MINLEDKFDANVEFIRTYIEEHDHGNIPFYDQGGTFVSQVRIAINSWKKNGMNTISIASGLVMNRARFVQFEPWINQGKYLLSISTRLYMYITYYHLQLCLHFRFVLSR